MLDTNVLLVSISGRSRYHSIFDAFLKERYELCVTTDILLEYEEVVRDHMGEKVSEYLLQIIENAPNVRWLTMYYKWNLIEADKDDNKFVDCAIACDAKFLMSDDRHLDVLKGISFPKVELLSAAEFRAFLLREKPL